MVQTPDLRSRLLYRLRSEDVTRRARGDRTEELGRSRRTGQNHQPDSRRDVFADRNRGAQTAGAIKATNHFRSRLEINRRLLLSSPHGRQPDEIYSDRFLLVFNLKIEPGRLQHVASLQAEV